jgi:hypothetical protein
MKGRSFREVDRKMKRRERVKEIFEGDSGFRRGG